MVSYSGIRTFLSQTCQTILSQGCGVFFREKEIPHSSSMTCQMKLVKFNLCLKSGLMRNRVLFQFLLKLIIQQFNEKQNNFSRCPIPSCQLLEGETFLLHLVCIVQVFIFNLRNFNEGCKAIKFPCLLEIFRGGGQDSELESEFWDKTNRETDFIQLLQSHKISNKNTDFSKQRSHRGRTDCGTVCTLCERKAIEGLSGQEADQKELHGVLSAFCCLQNIHNTHILFPTIQLYIVHSFQ